MDSNINPLRLMQHSQTQWRVSFGGPYALDYSAVFLVAEALGLTMNATLLHSLKILECEELSRMHKESDKMGDD